MANSNENGAATLDNNNVDLGYIAPKVIKVVGILNQIHPPIEEYNQKAWRYHVTVFKNGQPKTLELVSFRTSQMPVKEKNAYEFELAVCIAGKTEFINANGEPKFHKTDSYHMLNAIASSKELVMYQLQKSLRDSSEEEE